MLYLNGGTLCLGYIIGTTYGNIFDGLGKMIGCVNCMISPHSNGGLNIGLCVKWMVTDGNQNIQLFEFLVFRSPQFN